MPASAQKKVRRLANIEKHVDEIKDEIDRLHEIANPKRRLEAAKDLMEYIQLHHVEYPADE